MMETASSRLAAGRVHHQRDVLEEAGERLVFAHVVDELLEVLQPPRRLGRAVHLPHLGVAGFLQDHLGEIGVARASDQLLRPARKALQEIGERLPLLRLDLLGQHQLAGRRHQRDVARARMAVDQLDGGGAEAALRRVDDALEGEVVGRVHRGAEIGERVADLHALVEARAADHAVVQAERDEAVLELAHLVGGAHQDRHLVQRMAAAAAAARCPRRWRAPPPRNPSRR